MEKKHTADKIFLYFTAFLYCSLGILFLINPAGMASGLGYENLTKAGLTDIMATYGGLEFGIGCFIFHFTRQKHLLTAHYIVLYTFGGFAIGRIFGALKFNGFEGLHFYWFLSEITYILITVIFLTKFKKNQQGSK